jgi:hypothetical protein
MRRLVFITCLLPALLALAFSCAPVAATAQDSEKQRAQQLWEQAIAAKGGRGRLYAVRNIVISSAGSYKALQFKIHPDGETKSRSLKRSGLFREELYVFPNKYWLWDDYRPSVFGLWVEMYDYTTRMKYVVTDGDPNHGLEPIEANDLNTDKGLIITQLMYLLESEWVRPKPLAVTTVRIGFRVFDVVQTEVNGARYDFTLDRKTHLPVRFTFYSQDLGRTFVHTNEMSDYSDVDGINVPLTWKAEDGHKEKSEVKFNVEYDEKIFLKPPPFEAGPEAWKKK